MSMILIELIVQVYTDVFVLPESLLEAMRGMFLDDDVLGWM